MAFESYRIGQKVRLKAGHPWAGNHGTVIAFETLAVLRETGMRIRLENGSECFAVKEGDVESAEYVPARRKRRM